MPFIYNKRIRNAFRRLQEKISKPPNDHLLDELSTVRQATSNSTKGLQASPSHLSSVSSPSDIDVHSGFVMHGAGASGRQPGDAFLGNEKEPPARVVDGINDRTKRSLISKLYFANVDERLTGLPAAQGTTCRWFLTKSEYISWFGVMQ